MRRFILTGAPGAGKTAVIRQLEIDDFRVVEEAATDIIALELAAEEWWRPLSARWRLMCGTRCADRIAMS